MNVQLYVTKSDFCLPNLEKEFNDLGVDYEVKFIEEHPEFVSKHKIRHSPNIIVNGELVFTQQPSEMELKYFFDHWKE